MIDLTDGNTKHSEVFIFNGEEDLVLFVTFAEKCKLNLFNTYMKKITKYQNLMKILF